jgi:hypothetical protein
LNHNEEKDQEIRQLKEREKANADVIAKMQSELKMFHSEQAERYAKLDILERKMNELNKKLELEEIEEE